MQFTSTVPRIAALSLAAAASGAAVTGVSLRTNPTASSSSSSQTQENPDGKSQSEKIGLPSHSLAAEHAAQLILKEGYEEQDLTSLPQRPRHFLKSEDSAERLSFRYFRRKSDGAVSFIASFGSHVEGPPGFVHGGCSAAVLDSAMGMVAWTGGHRSVTANLTCNYRAPIPASSVQRVNAQIDKIEGRKVYLSSRIESLDGSKTYVESTALFIKPDPKKVVMEKLESIMKKATLPFRPNAADTDSNADIVDGR